PPWRGAAGCRPPTWRARPTVTLYQGVDVKAERHLTTRRSTLRRALTDNRAEGQGDDPAGRSLRVVRRRHGPGHAALLRPSDRHGRSGPPPVPVCAMRAAH